MPRSWSWTRIGDAVVSHAAQAATAISEARDRGAVPHLVPAATSTAEVVDGIAAALDFPSWFGRNLDALFDLLSDLSWQPEGEHVLVWAGHSVLRDKDPDGYRAVVAVLADAAAAPTGRPLTVILAEE